jgi:hypothetical protein
MFISDPDFYLPRITDPETAAKEKAEKISCPTFFCSRKYHKIETYFIFELASEGKIWANLQRTIEIFIQKIVIKLSKIWFGIRDPGSGKNLFFETLFIIPLSPWIS